jgi:anaerobic selenocysteine-containing dehydrogenase
MKWPFLPGVGTELLHRALPRCCKARGISTGDWTRVTTLGAIEIVAKAVVVKAIDTRCVQLPCPGWKQACKELVLKGYEYKEANPNILMPGNPSEESYGKPPYRSTET